MTEYNTTPQKVYGALMRMREIKNLYAHIEAKQAADKSLAFHNLDHIGSVTKIAEKLLHELGANKNIIYGCKIACLLHDIGCTSGKEGHAQRSRRYAESLFNNYGWTFEGKDEVLAAIENHSSGFETNNIIGLTLILADKLDIKKTRITEAGKKEKGNRQYQHIENIDVSIKNRTLSVDFTTDGLTDIREINDYYFTQKMFKAVEAFANNLKLKYVILMDGAVWKPTMHYPNNSNV